MKMPGGKLRELQKHWYKILEESGFEDIERVVGGELVLKQYAAHNLWDSHPLDREMEEEYFRIVSHHTNDETTAFRNQVDKMILQMYSDGVKIKDIVQSLETNGVPRNRASVRYIIRRYEVAWNIKQYSPRQLNKKAP